MKGTWQLSVLPIEQFAGPEQLATMTGESFGLLHATTSTGSRGIRAYGRGSELHIGKQSNLTGFWNRTMVREYSGSPCITRLWLAELEEGLEWGRGGETWTDKKLANHPQFSWASHPGTVENPYLGNTRGYGRAFDIINHSVALSGSDAYDRIMTAELTLRGRIRLAQIHSDRITDSRCPYKIKRPLLSENDGVKIGEADLDMDYSIEQLSQEMY
ncbi:hypothetical protein B0O99DRAFT_692107 [Bisporella sp. PMI_857]|nr:hypothetical protein B0O99DRAFT_692107 [Bisporella sp. PMI_857]